MLTWKFFNKNLLKIIFLPEIIFCLLKITTNICSNFINIFGMIRMISVLSRLDPLADAPYSLLHLDTHSCIYSILHLLMLSSIGKI